jgi:maleylacetoacetate isomerase
MNDNSSEIALYTYFRSSAAYRVRIALNLKGLSYEMLPIHLLRGEQRNAPYSSINPAQLLPALQVGGEVLTQSLAIIEFLEEAYPGTKLLPVHPLERARVRALALTIACEIHPLNNLRVLNRLRDEGFAEAERNDWYRHWVHLGFEALETQLANGKFPGRYCHGDIPGLADCCLVPQVFNARRFDCSLLAFPRIVGIYESCMELESFQRAAPEAQPDAR